MVKVTTEMVYKRPLIKHSTWNFKFLYFPVKSTGNVYIFVCAILEYIVLTGTIQNFIGEVLIYFQSI